MSNNSTKSYTKSTTIGVVIVLFALTIFLLFQFSSFSNYNPMDEYNQRGIILVNRLEDYLENTVEFDIGDIDVYYDEDNDIYYFRFSYQVTVLDEYSVPKTTNNWGICIENGSASYGTGDIYFQQDQEGYAKEYFDVYYEFIESHSKIDTIYN